MKGELKMKILIAYATKSGGSRMCAETLAAKIGNCEICDLGERTPDINEYDLVILGSGIRMGGAYRPFKAFLKKNAGTLLKKRTAYFICNMQTEKLQKIAEKNIPGDLRNAAVCVRTFGGKAPFGKGEDQSWMLTDEVDAFVREVKEIS